MEELSLCTRLANWPGASRQEPAGIGAMAAHIRACSLCRHGRIRLPGGFRVEDDLTHDQCRGHLPAYYEATRPVYPLVHVADAELVAVTLHLATCVSCREEYDALCLLSELEERDEGD
jgi:hypothetical protein